VKPHPRIRKTIKWGTAALTLLLVVVWLGSVWRAIHWMDGNRVVMGIENGCLFYFETNTDPVPSKRGLSLAEPFLSRLDWSFTWDSGKWAWEARCPLWLFVALVLMLTLMTWRVDLILRRRERVGHCTKCGYDRTGLAKDAKCPECGNAV
jgi:hypothetical protein